MSSLGRIALTGGVLLFVFFGLMTIVRSCNTDSDNVGEVGLVESGEEYDIFSDGEAVDVVVSDPEEGRDDDAGETPSSGAIDYTAVDEELEKPLTSEEEVRPIVVTKPKKKTKVQPKPKPAKKPTTPTSSATSSGKYLVVAGSFAVRDNAVKSVNKLKSQGFDGAKVVQFDNKNLHVVCAYQSDDYDSVTRMVRSLKTKGIDCYIKTRS
jgi:cell division septation protein DedD